MHLRNKYVALGALLTGLAACGDDTGTSGTTGGTTTGAGGDATTTTATSTTTTTGTGGQGGAEPAPAGPTNLVGAPVSATAADLTWTDNATNETGFRVERRAAGAATFAPIGTPLAANATTFSDTTATGGSFEYRVFAVNDTGDSAASNTALVHLPVPAQTATLSVNLTTKVVTVMTQPSHLNLSVTGNATWLGDGNPLTINLDVENTAYNRPVFNLKAVLTSLSGTATSTGDGTYAGDPFFHYGAAGIDVAASRAKDIVIDGALLANSPLLVDVTFANHPIVFSIQTYVGDALHAEDASGALHQDNVDFDMFGGASSDPGSTSTSGQSSPTGGAVSPDGRFVYYGVRNQPMIVAVDTLTMTPVAGADLTGANNIKHDDSGTGSIGFTRSVTISPDGAFLYVTLMTKMHAQSSGNCNVNGNDGTNPVGTIEVVKLNRATLAEVGRKVLRTGIDEAHARAVTLSADGSRAAVALHVYDDTFGNPANMVQGKFFVLDTATMMVIDGDPATGDQQAPFDVSSIGPELANAVISPDGTKVYFYMNRLTNDYALRELVIATGAITSLGPSTTFQPTRGTEMEFGPDGRLYWATMDGLAIYDPADQSWVEHAGYYQRPTRFAYDGKSYFTSPFTNGLEWYGIADDLPINNPADGTAGVPLVDQIQAHSLVITPF